MEPEKLRKKLNDCKATGKLNLSYMDLPELAPSVIQQIKVRGCVCVYVCVGARRLPEPNCAAQCSSPLERASLAASSIAGWMGMLRVATRRVQLGWARVSI
jgi:hypothetical protein